MDRRTFFKFGFVGSAGALVVPDLVVAAATEAMAGGVYLTREAPGRWSKKVTSHLPNIEVEKLADGARVRVHTRHPMDDYEHYIVKHMVLDGNYRYVDEQLFIPGTGVEAVSEFELAAYSGPVYVLSVCNQHDTWMNVAQI